MAEYIEREAIEYPYMTMTLWGLNNATCKAYNEGVKAAEDAIAAMPAADVVEVVRCKDCNALYREDERYVQHCCLIGTQVDDMDFCSCGERRGEDG